MVKSILVIGVGSFRHQNVHLGSWLINSYCLVQSPPSTPPGCCMLTLALCKIKKLSQRQSSILQKLLGAFHIQLAVQHWTEQKERDSMYVVYTTYYLITQVAGQCQEQTTLLYCAGAAERICARAALQLRIVLFDKHSFWHQLIQKLT